MPDVLLSDNKARSGSGSYTWPRETTDYIRLRFQLARFKVYRIVQLPRTFTFANLHTLIQYMFGWSDSHLHHAEVFPNVVLYDDEELSGTIKSCGRKRPLEDYELGDPSAIDHWTRFVRADQPIYRVQRRVTRRKDPIDNIMTIEERGLTLESIWTQSEASNVSDGQCTNAQIGIVYTYDLCVDWTVHITCERGSTFHRLDTPSNDPIFEDAQGAPPIEHAHCDIPGEYHAEEKTVPARLFDVSYFQGYCKGTVTSESRKTKLEIFTLEEAEERRREYLWRQKERQDRISSGEQDEDAEDEEDDDGDFDEE